MPHAPQRSARRPRSPAGEAADVLGRLMAGGVRIPCPATVEIGPEIRPERIAPGVTLLAGTRLRGAETAIGPDSMIGTEAPVTIEDCQLGAGVELKGGFFSGATFLDGSNMGSGAHVRPGTLLEEDASAAHAVGFKQTILLPFVTAGSLINFCDVLMAGGTSHKNHSEIGSSYVHFNFTPHQDKATASLLGDVPRGVMLDCPPVFLGGQGGLVGPVRIAFGTVVPAGLVVRRDMLDPDRLYREPVETEGTPRPFRPGLHRALDRTLANNFIYIGNLHALRLWYQHARAPFLERNRFGAACLAGALRRLATALEERRRRLVELREKMPRAMELAREEGWSPERIAPLRRWQERGAEAMEREAAGPTGAAGAAARDRFLAAWAHADRTRSYVNAVRALPPEARRDGTAWLQAVVDEVRGGWSERSEGA